MPYLAATDCRLSSHTNAQCPASTLSLELFQHLQYYGPSTRHRHLFLGSCPITSLPLVLQSQHFLISEGAVWGDHSIRPGHLIPPSATTEPKLLPTFRHEDFQQPVARDILFWLAQTPNNAVRYEVQQQLIDFRDSRASSETAHGLSGKVQIYDGLGRANSSYGRPTMATSISEMQRSIFCPAPPAENTAGLIRFFDVLRSGCIPVVVSFRTNWGSGTSWWRHNGPPVEWSLPFAWEVNWRQLVVEVSDEQLSSLGFVEACLQLGPEGVEAKQLNIARVRDHVAYDLDGGKRDAFSLLMDGIRTALSRLGPPPSIGLLQIRDSPQVCDRTPRSAQHRLLFPLGSAIREKAWSHSFTDASCSPAHAWQPPANFMSDQPESVLIEHYMTRRMLKDSLLAPAFWLRVLERSLVPAGDVHSSLAIAPLASCRHFNFPKACHDLLVQGEEQVTVEYCHALKLSPSAPQTMCTLVPTPLPAWHAGKDKRWEIITWGCGLEADFARLAENLQDVGSGLDASLDVILYEYCGALGAHAVLHHLHALLHARFWATSRPSTPGPDGVVVINTERPGPAFCVCPKLVLCPQTT